MEKLDLELLKKLGKFTHLLRTEVYEMPKKGMKISEIIDYVEKRIFSNGYLPAFPCTVCVNDMAAHYTIFDEDYELKESDVIKIDFGVSYDGFITDNAFTIEIGTNKYKDLMDANLEGLNRIMDFVNIGVKMEDIGEIVDSIAKKKGYNTIHNLSGHQISKNNLHCGLSVPNYKNLDTRTIKDGMELAIEPFFTTGEPKVKSVFNSNILHLDSHKPIRDPIAKKVLDFIKENFPHLPFSKRWLVKECRETLGLEGGFDKRKVLYALKFLKSNKNIYEYDALATVDSSIVTQFEDTVVFADNQKCIITRE